MEYDANDVDSYDHLMGSPMDPMEHPADGGHNDTYDKGRVQMAQTPIPPSPFLDVKPTKKPRLPKQPVQVPPNRI